MKGLLILILCFVTLAPVTGEGPSLSHDSSQSYYSTAKGLWAAKNILQVMGKGSYLDYASRVVDEQLFYLSDLSKVQINKDGILEDLIYCLLSSNQVNAKDHDQKCFDHFSKGVELKVGAEFFSSIIGDLKGKRSLLSLKELEDRKNLLNEGLKTYKDCSDRWAQSRKIDRIKDEGQKSNVRPKACIYEAFVQINKNIFYHKQQGIFLSEFTLDPKLQKILFEHSKSVYQCQFKYEFEKSGQWNDDQYFRTGLLRTGTLKNQIYQCEEQFLYTAGKIFMTHELMAYKGLDLLLPDQEERKDFVTKMIDSIYPNCMIELKQKDLALKPSYCWPLVHAEIMGQLMIEEMSVGRMKNRIRDIFLELSGPLPTKDGDDLQMGRSISSLTPEIATENIMIITDECIRDFEANLWKVLDGKGTLSLQDRKDLNHSYIQCLSQVMADQVGTYMIQYAQNEFVDLKRRTDSRSSTIDMNFEGFGQLVHQCVETSILKYQINEVSFFGLRSANEEEQDHIKLIINECQNKGRSSINYYYFEQMIESYVKKFDLDPRITNDLIKGTSEEQLLNINDIETALLQSKAQIIEYWIKQKRPIWSEIYEELSLVESFKDDQMIKTFVNDDFFYRDLNDQQIKFHLFQTQRLIDSLWNSLVESQSKKTDQDIKDEFFGQFEQCLNKPRTFTDLVKLNGLDDEDFNSSLLQAPRSDLPFLKGCQLFLIKEMFKKAFVYHENQFEMDVERKDLKSLKGFLKESGLFVHFHQCLKIDHESEDQVYEKINQCWNHVRIEFDKAKNLASIFEFQDFFNQSKKDSLTRSVLLDIMAGRSTHPSWQETLSPVLSCFKGLSLSTQDCQSVTNKIIFMSLKNQFILQAPTKDDQWIYSELFKLLEKIFDVIALKSQWPYSVSEVQDISLMLASQIKGLCSMGLYDCIKDLRDTMALIDSFKEKESLLVFLKHTPLARSFSQLVIKERFEQKLESGIIHIFPSGLIEGHEKELSQKLLKTQRLEDIFKSKEDISHGSLQGQDVQDKVIEQLFFVRSKQELDQWIQTSGIQTEMAYHLIYGPNGEPDPVFYHFFEQIIAVTVIKLNLDYRFKVFLELGHFKKSESQDQNQWRPITQSILGKKAFELFLDQIIFPLLTSHQWDETLTMAKSAKNQMQELLIQSINQLELQYTKKNQD